MKFSFLAQLVQRGGRRGERIASTVQSLPNMRKMDVQGKLLETSRNYNDNLALRT